jgi:hypothetical protein
MPEITLETLAARVAELEREVTSLKSKTPSVVTASRDWRSVVGICDDNEFTRAMDAEIAKRSEEERQKATEMTNDLS